MLVVYRIQNSILSKIKYNLFFIDTLVIECCQIIGNNTADRHLYGHLILHSSRATNFSHSDNLPQPSKLNSPPLKIKGLVALR